MVSVADIGAGSSRKIKQLERLIESVRRPDVPDVDKVFGNVLDKLRTSSVRLLVVGQVKAGKSSLINALTGVGNFLPTEVNPWTAVITNLHFGHPDKADCGGEFQLFSESEWDRMLHGDSETRILAEELLPGFSSTLLQVQVEEMRESAKVRLGSMYHHLLGKKHVFNKISPEILDRYVSAGYGDGQEAGATAGRFSGITKSAEVFMPPGPFRVPVTVSDTPGINDPFLVRDEITTRSFRNADIFIVALSVHQALNTPDVALLKMLSMHPGKTTLIFVNRIDELDDPSVAVPDVLRNLDARLQAELDQSNYTLIAGSAAWGRIAVNGSDADVAAATGSAAFKSYWQDFGDADDTPLREKLHVVSGLDTLATAISEIIAAGPTETLLSSAVSEVCGAVSLLKTVLKDQVDRHDNALLDVDDIDAIIATEQHRIENLAMLADALQDVSNEARAALLGNGDVVFKSVMNTINATVGAFVDAQTHSLQDAFGEDGSVSNWRLDTVDLCARVEQQICDSYGEGRKGLDRILAGFAEKISALVTPVVGDVKVGKLLDNLPHDEILPGFKPASTLVDVELVNERGWKFWQRTEMNRTEAVERLKHIIRAEMFPAIKSSSDVARISIAERTGEALNRLSGLVDAARQLILTERETLEADALALAQGGSSALVARINAERKELAAQRRAQLDVLETAQKTLHTEFQRFTSEEAAPAPVRASISPGGAA